MISVDSGFVVSEVTNNHPQLSIIPCSLDQVCQNRNVSPSVSGALHQFLIDNFKSYEAVVDDSCRSSLRRVLNALGVNTVNDEVAVFTTSGKPYLSSCVSSTIELSGSWVREKVTQKTKVILLVHEFGYPLKDVESFRKYDLPIIEDAAFSFNSKCPEGVRVGSRSDYLVCSFSKFFDIQIGGAAMRMSRDVPKLGGEVGDGTIQYVKGVVADQLHLIEQNSAVRIRLLEYYVRKFSSLGASPYFDYSDGVVPGVFLFKPPIDWDLPRLKEFLWSRGIQCTVFYGEHAFYLPLHHRMNESVIDYIFTLIVCFLDESK